MARKKPLSTDIRIVAANIKARREHYIGEGMADAKRVSLFAIESLATEICRDLTADLGEEFDAAGFMTACGMK